MNLDAMNERWLSKNYYLHSLSQMVQRSCYLGNFVQLVKLPTRFQHNSVRGLMEISLIDHVYTNCKFRCSDITVSAFGASDHDIVEYVRYSKLPPSPARTIVRRSYKNFNIHAFLRDLSFVDWSDIYRCYNVDKSVELFTTKFVMVLDWHAPWIRYQQREKYCAWLTEVTKDLIKQSDCQKRIYEDNAKQGNTDAAAIAWNEFKKLRNTVNNRKKFEEKTFKSEKLEASIDCPTTMWNTAKYFMDWKKAGGPPTQLEVNGVLVKKAKFIAQEMNAFFLSKVDSIRNKIADVQNTLRGPQSIMSGKSCKLVFSGVSVSKVNRLIKEYQ